MSDVPQDPKAYDPDRPVGGHFWRVLSTPKPAPSSMTGIRQEWLDAMETIQKNCPESFKRELLEFGLLGNRLLNDAWVQGELDMAKTVEQQVQGRE